MKSTLTSLDTRQSASFYEQALDSSGSTTAIVEAITIVLKKPSEDANQIEKDTYNVNITKIVDSIQQLTVNNQSKGIKLANELIDSSGNDGKEAVITILERLGLSATNTKSSTRSSHGLNAMSSSTTNLSSRELSRNRDSNNTTNEHTKALETASILLSGIKTENSITVVTKMGNSSNVSSRQALINILGVMLNDSGTKIKTINIFTEMGQESSGDKITAASNILAEMGKDQTQTILAVNMLTQMSVVDRQKNSAINILSKMRTNEKNTELDNLKNAMSV
jgi:hypothetical protein